MNTTSQATGLPKEVASKIRAQSEEIAALYQEVAAEAEAIRKKLGVPMVPVEVGLFSRQVKTPGVLVDVAQNVAFMDLALRRGVEHKLRGGELVQYLQCLCLPTLVRDFCRHEHPKWPTLPEDFEGKAIIALLHSALVVGDATFVEYAQGMIDHVERGVDDLAEVPLWVEVESGKSKVRFPMGYDERCAPPCGNEWPERLFFLLVPHLPPPVRRAKGMHFRWLLWVHPTEQMLPYPGFSSPLLLDLGGGVRGMLVLHITRAEEPATKGAQKSKQRDLFFFMTASEQSTKQQFWSDLQDERAARLFLGRLPPGSTVGSGPCQLWPGCVMDTLPLSGRVPEVALLIGVLSVEKRVRKDGTVRRKSRGERTRTGLRLLTWLRPSERRELLDLTRGYCRQVASEILGTLGFRDDVEKSSVMTAEHAFLARGASERARSREQVIDEEAHVILDRLLRLLHTVPDVGELRRCVYPWVREKLRLDELKKQKDFQEPRDANGIEQAHTRWSKSTNGGPFPRRQDEEGEEGEEGEDCAETQGSQGWLVQVRRLTEQQKARVCKEIGIPPATSKETFIMAFQQAARKRFPNG